MAVQLNIKNGYEFNIKDLEAVLPHSDAVKKIKTMINVIGFYANPQTYFAIAHVPDDSAGEFMEDFSETEELGMKPGKTAREFLEKLEKEL